MVWWHHKWAGSAVSLLVLWCELPLTFLFFRAMYDQQQRMKSQQKRQSRWKVLRYPPGIDILPILSECLGDWWYHEGRRGKEAADYWGGTEKVRIHALSYSAFSVFSCWLESLIHHKHGTYDERCMCWLVHICMWPYFVATASCHLNWTLHEVWRPLKQMWSDHMWLNSFCGSFITEISFICIFVKCTGQSVFSTNVLTVVYVNLLGTNESVRCLQCSLRTHSQQEDSAIRPRPSLRPDLGQTLSSRSKKWTWHLKEVSAVNIHRWMLCFHIICNRWFINFEFNSFFRMVLYQLWSPRRLMELFHWGQWTALMHCTDS